MAGMADHGEISQATLGRLRALSDRSMHRAGESLTSLLGHPVRLEVSGIERLPASTLPALATGGSAEHMAGLRFQITGEAGGDMVLLFPRSTIFRMLGRLLGRSADPRPLSEEERSALQEVGNILVSSFLSELGDLLGRRLIPSPPQAYFDDVPRLIQEVIREVGGGDSEILVVQARFTDAAQEIEGRFLVLPEMASLLAMIHGPEDGDERPAR